MSPCSYDVQSWASRPARLCRSFSGIAGDPCLTPELPAAKYTVRP